MSEKNADVERAISAFGDISLNYQSFGPFAMRPRTAPDARTYTYNEFGEAEYVTPPVVSAPTVVPPAPRGADPLYDTLPVLQPPVPRPMPPPMAPPPMPGAHVMGAPQPVQRQQLRPAVPAAPVAPPAPPAPPPPPFFPLLAAALPNATEPTYTPSYPPAPPPSYVSDRPPGMVDSGPYGASTGPAHVASTAPAPVDASDRRSLTEMFRLLQGRTDGPAGGLPAAAAPAPVAPSRAPAGEGQALFRRI